MRDIMRKFLCAENGATAIEYGLIAGLVFLVVVGAVRNLGDTVLTALFQKVAAAL